MLNNYVIDRKHKRQQMLNKIRFATCRSSLLVGTALGVERLRGRNVWPKTPKFRSTTFVLQIVSDRVLAIRVIFDIQKRCRRESNAALRRDYIIF